MATVTMAIAANAMPPQTDVIVSVDQGTAKTSVKTATFSTASANELLLAFVSVDGNVDWKKGDPAMLPVKIQAVRHADSDVIRLREQTHVAS